MARTPPPGRPFPKGVSPCPGGRPKAASAMARMIRERTKDGAELVEFALEVWAGLIDGMKTDKSRQWAHDWLSDRGFGKPLQSVDVTSAGGGIDFTNLTEPQLEALAALGASNPPEGDGGDGGDSGDGSSDG